MMKTRDPRSGLRGERENIGFLLRVGDAIGYLGRATRLAVGTGCILRHLRQAAIDLFKFPLHLAPPSHRLVGEDVGPWMVVERIWWRPSGILPVGQVEQPLLNDVVRPRRKVLLDVPPLTRRSRSIRPALCGPFPSTSGKEAGKFCGRVVLAARPPGNRCRRMRSK